MTIENRYNVDLLRATRDQVLMEPEKHDQATWGQFRHKRPVKAALGEPVGDDVFGLALSSYALACPTTACVAGWAVILAGGKLLVEQANVDVALANSRKRLNVGANSCLTHDGDVQGVAQYAQTQMGLNDEEAYALFASHASYEKVLELLEGYIKAGELLHGR